MTQQTPSPKETLAQLIEAYAAARSTGNTILTGSSAQMLESFFTQVEITQKEAKVLKTVPMTLPNG